MSRPARLDQGFGYGRIKSSSQGASRSGESLLLNAHFSSRTHLRRCFPVMMLTHTSSSPLAVGRSSVPPVLQPGTLDLLVDLR